MGVLAAEAASPHHQKDGDCLDARKAHIQSAGGLAERF
jgi:hypothetical protein